VALLAPVLSIVIPCFNEEEVLPETARAVRGKLAELVQSGRLSDASFICFVDDGSRDKTWSIIKDLSTGGSIVGIKLAHNAGHQKALIAGLMYSKDHSDCVISMDADLQDDIDVIDEFIEAYSEGCKIVYGARRDRSRDAFFKRFTAEFFYKVMKAMGVELVFNHADYRLVDSAVLHHLEEYQETHLFLRGIFPAMGFTSRIVYYDRKARLAGNTKYPLKKQIAFALEGIASFSVKPLKLVTWIGMIVFILCSVMGVYTFWQKFTGNSVPGWASNMLSIYFLGSVQILSLGVIGEYIGKIYQEVKRRPRYIIEDIAAPAFKEAKVGQNSVFEA